MTDLTAITSNTTAIVTAAVSVGIVTLLALIKYVPTITIASREASEAKKDAAEAKTQSAVLGSRVNQQDTIINEIRRQMAPVEQIPELVTGMNFIKEVVIKQLVPRTELMQKWEADEQRFARLEADVRDIKENPHA